MSRRGSLVSRSLGITLLLCAAAPAGLHAQVPPTPGSGAARDASWLRDATTLLAHGKVDEALAAAAVRPEDDADARVVRARIALRAGRQTEAEALLKPAADADPASEAALELAFLYRDRGRDEAASLLFDAVANTAASAANAAAVARAARATAALGEFRQANQLFRRASRAASGDPSIETAWGELFLDKHNTEDAARSFGEALKADPLWVPAHLGIARALADANPPAALEALARVRAIDPGLAALSVVEAQLHLDAGRRVDARAALARALEQDPADLEARSLVAGIARLEDRQADFDSEASRVLAQNPRYAGAYDTAADLLARAYRFDEAVALGRKAVQINPADPRVLAHLGVNLMRTGDEAEARQALDAAFRIDPYDVVTYNLLALIDTLDDFETIEAPPFVFRFNKNESAVLKEYAPSLAREALDTLTKRYGFTPAGPILVEVFPRHDDFAVRTLGLPGLLGALGACFGRVVTMDSPKARPPNTFSWQATLWHELTHVITLQMSKQRVPRWLTEGISVYEEGRARPEWGREMEVTFARAWRDGKVAPIRDLNAAFTSPDTIALAYYEASLLVEHLVRLRGEEGVIALLKAYGQGLDDDAALHGAVGATTDGLQAGFDAMLKARFESLARAVRDVPQLGEATTVDALTALSTREPDSFLVQMKLAQALAEGGDRAGAMDAYARASALVPRATGPESPRAQLAALAESQDDHARAIRELLALLEVDHTNVDAARRLQAIADRAGDATAAKTAATRVVALDPFDSAAHSALGRAALANGDHGTAAREFRVALTTGPADAAAAHCDLGEAYFAAGKTVEAKREALASLEVAPLFERAQDLLLKAVEARK